jgi:hypothetical protein
VLDPRRAAEIAAGLFARRPGYLAAWRPAPQSPGDGLTRVCARYLEALLDRLNQAPEKNRIAFLDLAGIDRTPATAARAPVVFQLSKDAAAQHLPAGTRVAAPPPPEGGGQIVFETERAGGLTPGRLVEAVSLWPGRDESIDHGAAVAAGEPIRLFSHALMAPTPHHLYLAHDVLLALAGRVTLKVAFELAQPGSEPLTLAWEYWDGEVWRPFARPGCGGGGGDASDGTAQLTKSGTVTLVSDCADAKPTAVAGLTSHWVRARLDETLPLDPGQILPEVSGIKLTAVHRRELTARIAAFTAADTPADTLVTHGVALTLTDAAAGPVKGARVEIAEAETGHLLAVAFTDGAGLAPLNFPDAGPRHLTLTVETLAYTLVKRFPYEPPSGSLTRLAATLAVELDALVPEKAFADADKLDLSKPFYPLGQAPKPGSTFAFAAPEALAKPGARLTVQIERATTPQDKLSVTGTSPSIPLPHTVSWEYYDGRRWVPLLVAKDGPGDLNKDGEVHLVVPGDAAKTVVNGVEDLWLRVRLLDGSYGFSQEVTWSDGGAPPKTNHFVYVLPQPPALKSMRLSYVWEQGPLHAETVLAYNDFHFVDHTDAARWPEDPFLPFAGVADRTPALYLGFDAPFPVDRLSLYFDLAEERGADRPALVWEYWAGGWRRLVVEDGTRHLAFPGTVSFIGPGDALPLARFGAERSWLRARLAADGPPPEVMVAAILPNALWVEQRETVVEEVVGASRGLPNESFRIRRFPVLAGERVEVRELDGPRAAVEWRRLALEVLGGGEEQLRDLERRLGQEGGATDIEQGNLRLRRDAAKTVVEVWVCWLPARRLVECGPLDRCYALDRASGGLAFGDGEHGRVLPLGARVLARRYVSGGGRVGNVAAGAIKQALTGLAGIETISNPVPAEGGSDAETMAAVARRGPRTLAHRGRGLAAADLETMAREASPAVAVARVLPVLDAAGRRRPGWATLVLVPASEAPRPYPSVGLRERVLAYLAERAEAGLVAGGRFSVTGPDYFAVEVEAEIIPADPAAAADVESAARAALSIFLHPLSGGPDGEGWEPGRSVYLSDVASLLEGVSGVDAVERLELLTGGVPRGEVVPVPPGGTVAAGEIRLSLVAARS